MVFFVVFGEDLQVTTLRQMQFHYWGHIIMQWYLANVQTNVIAKQNDNHCRKIIAVKCWQSVSNSGIGRFLIWGSCFFARTCCKSGGSIHRIVCLHQKHSVIHHKMSWHQKRNLRPNKWYTLYEYCYPGIPGAESLRFLCSNPQEAWTDLNVPFKIFDMGWTFWKYAGRSIFGHTWP